MQEQANMNFFIKSQSCMISFEDAWLLAKQASKRYTVSMRPFVGLLFSLCTELPLSFVSFSCTRNASNGH